MGRVAAGALLVASASILCAQPEVTCSPAQNLQVDEQVKLSMTNGDVLQGKIASVDATSITIHSSYGALTIPRADIGSAMNCAILPKVAASSITVPTVKTTTPALNLYGLEKLTVSLGFTGSAQRDESYSAAPTFYDFTENTRTLLSLSASYDDKWKAAAHSSNVTQVYSGDLSEMLFPRKPVPFVLGGSAYRNNSQGVVIDEAYRGGIAVPIQVSAMTGFQLSGDLRAIYDQMNAPGPTAWMVGSYLGGSYSECFPDQNEKVCSASSGSVDMKVGIIPVFNRAKSWQGSGVFDAFKPLSKTMSVGLTVIDNYLEIAPKGFNKNYLKISLAFKYTPSSTK